MQTFVFTDIEASTRLWEEHPEAMASALARHDELLQAVLAAGGGRVLKTTGDGMIATFDDPAGAVEASIEIQRRLGTEAWGDTGPIKVRIGVHSGETESRDGDFFGPTMNRTARIMAAGHGGQILVSAATAAQSKAVRPGGADLRDLGSHRLKDLTDPEHLYQVIHPDIPSEFPDLMTLTTSPNNLPRQMTEFLGRDSELSSIEVMLDSESTRLLTLSGPGGAGKTRLSLQVAADSATRFRDGVFFVDLAAERDAQAAFESVVRALDLPGSGDGTPLDTLKTRLRDKEMLLVLDNFEQVMSAASGVNELVQACPRLKVVVTSRETLRVRAERVFPVPPLELADPRGSVAEIARSEAVQLFVDRARAVSPGFELTADTASVVAEICLRLDGLPLAVELAAARLNVFTPSDLLSRLKDRLDVLGAGGRDLPDRQRTLWGAIGWSYELLDDDERALLETMSVFSGATLEAVEVVATQSLDVTSIFDSLGSLVDKSLVRSDTSGASTRFSMLLMIKEYAESKLGESPERDASVRREHARHYSEFTRALHERLRAREREEAMLELESEIGNLRAAWRFWVAEGDLGELFGLLDGLWALHEAKGWYHAAIELARDMLAVLSTTDGTPELAAEELALRTSLARALMAVRGYDIEVEEAFKSALELSESAGTPAQRFPVLRALASYYTLSGDLGQAAATGQQLLDLGQEARDRSMLLEGHYVVGMAIGFGDVDASMPHLEKAIELHDPREEGSNRFRSGANTGVVARIAATMTLWLSGDLGKATAHASDALSLARKIDHPFSIAYALYHSGFLSLMRSRFAECRGFATELRDVASANRYEIWETLATVLEGAALSGLGQVGPGLEKTEKGIVLYQGLTTPPIFWPFLLDLRAAVHAAAGQPDRAIELIDEAISSSPPELGILPGLQLAKADYLRMLANTEPEEVEALYRADIDLARALKLRMVELRAATRLVTFRRETQTSPDGSEELKAAISKISEGHNEHDMVVAREVLAAG